MLRAQEPSLFVILWEAWEGQDLYEVWTSVAYETIITDDAMIVKWVVEESNLSLPVKSRVQKPICQRPK